MDNNIGKNNTLKYNLVYTQTSSSVIWGGGGTITFNNINAKGMCLIQITSPYCRTSSSAASSFKITSITIGGKAVEVEQAFAMDDSDTSAIGYAFANTFTIFADLTNITSISYTAACTVKPVMKIWELS